MHNPSALCHVVAVVVLRPTKARVGVMPRHARLCTCDTYAVGCHFVQRRTGPAGAVSPWPRARHDASSGRQQPLRIPLLQQQVRYDLPRPDRCDCLPWMLGVLGRNRKFPPERVLSFEQSGHALRTRFLGDTPSVGAGLWPCSKHIFRGTQLHQPSALRGSTLLNERGTVACRKQGRNLHGAERRRPRRRRRRKWWWCRLTLVLADIPAHHVPRRWWRGQREPDAAAAAESRLPLARGHSVPDFLGRAGGKSYRRVAVPTLSACRMFSDVRLCCDKQGLTGSLQYYAAVPFSKS